MQPSRPSATGNLPERPDRQSPAQIAGDGSAGLIPVIPAYADPVLPGRPKTGGIGSPAGLPVDGEWADAVPDECRLVDSPLPREERQDP